MATASSSYRFDPLIGSNHKATTSSSTQARDSYVVRETMKRLLTRLPEDQFLRVHRSHIVNLDRMVEIHTMFRGDAEIHLKNGVRIPLSRHYRSGLNRYHL